MRRDELINVLAKGLYYLDNPMCAPTKWSHCAERTRDLYIAKARFVWSYVDDADEELYSGEAQS